MGLEDILLGDPTVAIAGVSTGRERELRVRLSESRYLLHPPRSAPVPAVGREEVWGRDGDRR